MSEQKVLVGSTSSLVSYPRVSDGGAWVRGQTDSVASIPSLRVGSPAVAMPAAFSATGVTRDSISVVTTAAAVEGATTITVASAAWLRGRRYLVETTDGQYLDVTSRRTATGTTLYLAEPLPCPVPSGSAVKGWAVVGALTALQTATPGNALALWKSVVGGVTYIWSQSFRILRRIPVSTLTPTGLTTSWPSIRGERARNDLDFEEVILVAWEHRVLPLLAARGVNEEDIISVEALEPLHALACVLHLATANARITPEVFDRLEARWNQLVETTFARKDWWDAPQDVTPEARPEEPLTVKTGIRLTR